MQTKQLGPTSLHIVPLVFGGNVFGWTIDEPTSFNILDAFVDAGFNAIDTADVYSAWAPGNNGGESETIIGNWLHQRPGIREKITLFTKVGSDMGAPGKKGLSRTWILQAVDESLARLQTDYIDLYFSHWPDPETEYEESLAAYDTLLQSGKVRHIGASNLSAQQLQDALTAARTHNLPEYAVLQPEYNLYDRSSYDGPLRELCLKEGLGVVTYYSLASGFLSGKYREKKDLAKSVRGTGLEKYLTDRGFRILDTLEQVAEKYQATPAELALAWLIARPGVTAPIASATKQSHVESFSKAVRLKLDQEDMDSLTKASEA